MDQKQVKPFGLSDKIGYLFGDFGNDFTFIFASTFLMVFYMKVLGIPGAAVGTLFLVARVVDAFTDVTMGRIVDICKPGKDGRFKQWIRRMAGPVAIASFLMYQSSLAGASMTVKVVYMYATYLLWGSICYTGINIPYGSMASAVSADPKDRAELSTWRTIGSTLANMVIGVATPMVAYVVVDGKTVMSGSRMTIIAGVFSICAILCYIVCFKLTRERVEVPASSQKVSASAIFKSIFTNRALLGIIVAAIFVLLSQLTVMSLAGYVYPNVYGSAAAQSTASLLGTVVMLIVCAPFASKLAAKFGKKELAVASSICSALVWLVCLIWRPASVWGFVACYILANIGMGFFNTIIWAMITDVIDDAEVRSGIREDGTIYSVYSFARKLGQAFSSGLVGALLGIIGYTEATAFDPAVTRGIFNMACIAPIIGFVCIVLALVFLYPLNKKKVEENVAALAARRNSK